MSSQKMLLSICEVDGKAGDDWVSSRKMLLKLKLDDALTTEGIRYRVKTTSIKMIFAFTFFLLSILTRSEHLPGNALT